MKIMVINTVTGLVPKYGTDYEAKKRLPIGWEGIVTVTLPRNYEFHKKFFALLMLGFENQDSYDNFDDYRALITCRAGYYKEIKTDKGVVYMPKSISFAKMDEFAFEELYNKVINLLIKDLKISAEDINNEIINFL